MGVSRSSAVLVGPVLLLLTGCGSFFNPSTTSTGTGSSTGNGTGGSGAVYLANYGAQSVSAFSVASGKLANLNVSGTLGDSPLSLAMNPAHSLLWVGTSLGYLFAYTIGSNGSLTLSKVGTASYVFNVPDIPISSIAVDPTGKYLLALCNTGTATAPIVYVLAIGANGALTQLSTQGLDAGTAFQIAFTPDGTRVYVALGTGGVDALTFNTGNGALTKLSLRQMPLTNSSADQGLAVDPGGKYLLVTETGLNGVRVLDIANNLNALGAYASDLGARGVLVDHTGAYVYVTNSTKGTISQFALSSTGTLTPLAAPTVPTGTSPYALAEDSSSTFVLAACSGGSPDLQMFSIGTDGSLSSVQVVTSGSGTATGAVAVVATPPAS